MRPAARIAVVAALCALAGCSGEEPTESKASLASSEPPTVEKQWRMDLEDELGFDGFDFEAAVNQAIVDCERTAAADWKLSLALDGDLEGSGVTRVGLKYACPDVLDAFDEAYDEVSAAPSLSAYVCTLPREAMSAGDLQMVQIACAS